MADTDDSTFTAEEIVVQQHKKERKELQCMCSHNVNKELQTTFFIILSFVYWLSGNIEKTLHRITPNLLNTPNRCKTTQTTLPNGRLSRGLHKIL